MILELYLEDEAPAIGSGRRRVIVEAEGPKWVRIINPTTLRTAKIGRRVWDQVVKRASRIEINRRDLRQYARTRIEAIASTVPVTEKEEKQLKATVIGLNGRLRRVLKAA